MKTRGLRTAENNLGELSKLVREKLKQEGNVRILEAGCGFGHAMLDLQKKFGNKVEIVGFNLKPRHGNSEIMKKFAVKRKIFTSAELKTKKLPEIVFLDVNNGLPFKNNYFDLVYSQASVYLYAEKMKFFEEVNRILSKNGVARIEAALGRGGNKSFPEQFRTAYEIWHRGKQIPIKQYLKHFRNLRILNNSGCLEIRKAKKFQFGLTLVSSINYNKIWKQWYGVKSIYTTMK